MSRRVLYAIAAAGVLVALYGGLFGPWWLTFPGAFAVGVVMARARTAIAVGALVGLVGWATPLETIQSRYGLGPTAEALAAILGVNGAALVPVALTIFIGVLLGLVGAWLGSAARAFLPRSSGPVQKLRHQRLEVKDPVLTKS